jgi:DNA-binding CsgD family transcriptional regulator/PAS domain-containing protein
MDELVSRIYDCAANPSLWDDTLVAIRDRLRSAYVMIGYADMGPLMHGGQPVFHFHHSPWDRSWLMRLQGLTDIVPGAQSLLDGTIDRAWTQLGQLPREAFVQTQFNKQWAEPQGLVDSLNVPYVFRQKAIGLLSASISDKQGAAFDDAQCRMAEYLAPHVRRAMLINEMVDKDSLALTLYRKTLDTLSIAVFVVGSGGRIMFCNAAGEEMVVQGTFLQAANGLLLARNIAGAKQALDSALDRAAQGDAALGIAGIGVPLTGPDGEKAAAYVLPVAGKDVRGDLGAGTCVVFVARRGEHQPMAMEILRTMFDMTLAEARVALMLAQGQGPQAIASALDVSINTVRTHLQHAFTKTDTADQTALVGLINGLLPRLG